MTVDQMKAEMKRLNGDIATLNSDIKTITQFILQSKSFELVDDSLGLIYEIQNAINAFDSQYAAEQITNPAILSQRDTWVNVLKEQIRDMKNYGYRCSKAFGDMSACEDMLLALEKKLAEKEEERRLLRLELKKTGSSEYGFFAWFSSWRKPCAVLTKKPAIEPLSKTPAALLYARADNQRKVDSFQRELLFDNIQSSDLSSDTRIVVQQHRRPTI